MLSKISTFVIVMATGINAFAYDLLRDVSVVEKEGTSCEAMVQSAVTKYTGNSHQVLVHSHISTTQGTYNQVFISVVSVDGSYYTMVSEGEFSCDNMLVVGFKTINLK
jgi:hypothetical protein